MILAEPDNKLWGINLFCGFAVSGMLGEAMGGNQSLCAAICNGVGWKNMTQYFNNELTIGRGFCRTQNPYILFIK